MDIAADQKQISAEERAEINKQVKAELVEHLYQGCLPGTITGVPVGIAFFIDFFGYTPNHLLFAWFAYYNLALIALTGLYFFYRRYKSKYSLQTWLISYSIVMSLCALAWGMSVYLIPDHVARQYFAFIALFILGTGYATGTIGVFPLCVVTQAIIVIPLASWCFMQGSLFYTLIGVFTIMYMGFMLGINRRSTVWFKDSLALKLENTLVSYQASHDLLTHLPNKRLLPQYVDAAIQLVQDTGNTFALASFSLNRIEIINDSMGHHAGDLIVQSVANRLNQLAAEQQGVRYLITISRKDVFNIIIVPVREDNVKEYIQRIFSILEEPFYLERKAIKMTASIGVSLYLKHGVDLTTLLSNADSAMLQAKSHGGNHFILYRSEINAQRPKQLEIESDLHRAVSKQEFKLHYQPLIDLKTNQVCGMEALIRWPHAVHGFISPMHFIPIAEETGLIVPIGEWVLYEACAQTKLWHDMGFKELRVAVNVSQKQMQIEIVELVERVLEVTKLPASALELEITETAILDESALGAIQRFNDMGISLAVDDFGTGYSGLSYLKRFSIDKLKIDQSFIRDIPTNNDSMTIVAAIIAMSKELGLRVLAEGVETEDQLAFLKSKGCDYIQGYYFSKPLETNTFTKFIMERRGIAAMQR